jgi:hypothetical protein
MKISLETMVQKYNNCVVALDEKKHCCNCLHHESAITAEPCSECYNEMLGMPVNPTKWEAATV